MKRILLTSLLALCTLTVNAATYEKVITTANGSTLDQAIDVGLRRAVEQVAGVSIDSDRTSATSYASDGENSKIVDMMADVSRLKSKGDVKYQILHKQCSNSVCEVKLEVSVKVDPRSKVKDLNSNRRTIAIAKFTGTKGNVIGKKIAELLVQDRKFKVLDNQQDPALQYVVSGKIIEAKTTKRVVNNSRTVELTGEYVKDVKTYYSSKVVVSFKIVDVVNNQVKWSATIPTTSSRNNLSLLVDIASKKVFNQLKDNIYPLVVLKGENGSLVLNSGGNTVKVDQYFDVFNLGEQFFDPITKESLGRDEIKVATVRVTKVLPKLAYITVIKGNVDQIQNHSFARKSSYKKVNTKNHSKSKGKVELHKEEKKSVGIVL